MSTSVVGSAMTAAATTSARGALSIAVIIASRTPPRHAYGIRRIHCSSRLSEQRKPSIQAIAQVRKHVPGTSMLKAREALAATWNDTTSAEDVQAALAWLEEDRRKTGAKKADKVASRQAHEGLVAICVLSDGLPSIEPSSSSSSSSTASATSWLRTTPPAQAGLVELNCETDFVARNDVFRDLVRDLAHTAALFPTLSAATAATGAARRPASTPSSSSPIVPIDVEHFLGFPLLPASSSASPSSSSASAPRLVRDAILDAVSRLGERIHLARAASLSAASSVPDASAPRRSSLRVVERLVTSSFSHGDAAATANAAAAAPTSTAASPGFSLTTGKVGSLLLTAFREAPVAADDVAERTAYMRGLVRSLARQTAGFTTTSVRGDVAAAETVDDAADVAPDAESTHLYAQPFAMLLSSSGLSASAPDGAGERSVAWALRSWSQRFLSKPSGPSAAAAAEAPSSKATSAAATTRTARATPGVEVVGLARWEVGGVPEASSSSTAETDGV